MNKKVLVVSFTYPDAKSGELFAPEEMFVVPYGESDETVESLLWAIAIQENGPSLETYRATLDELNARREELRHLADGRIEFFEIDGSRYYAKAMPFEQGRENPLDLNEARPGTTLYIRYDGEGNELGVFAECPGFEEVTKYVRFFKTSDPQMLTLHHFMPFVIDGEYGYMIDPKQERLGASLKYAKPLAGFFYFVVDSDEKGYIVDVTGRKVTESPTRIDFDNPGYNGYIIFTEGDKWGFIHTESGIKSPVVFDGILTVEIGEPVNVKKDGEWGFLTETFDFIPESAIEEDDSLTDDIYWYGDV